MHAKRQTIGKTWPIPRKGTKYLVIASHENKNSVPVLIILREIMKLAKNRKEAKKILGLGMIKVNGKTIRKDNFSVLPFDIIEVGDKKYELGFSEKGKFEVKDASREERILKVIGKKTLRGKKIQLNLIYGKNILTTEKVDVGNSVIVKDKKITKIIPIEVGKEAVVLSGKYRGREGEIKEIKDKIAILSSDKGKINVPIDNIMAIK